MSRCDGGNNGDADRSREVHAVVVVLDALAARKHALRSTMFSVLNLAATVYLFIATQPSKSSWNAWKIDHIEREKGYFSGHKGEALFRHHASRVSGGCVDGPWPEGRVLHNPLYSYR